MKWYNRVEFGKMGCVMKNPPFEITRAMLTASTEIAELVGRLSAGKLSSSPILRRTNRIRTLQCKRKPFSKNAQNVALRRQFVLDFIKENMLTCNANLCEGLGVSPATANRILRELSEDGTLERVRDRKVWAYRFA